MRASIITLLLVLPISLLLSQTDEKKECDAIKITPDSKAQEISIPVKADDASLSIEILSELKSGALTIEITTPDGELVAQQAVVHGNAKGSSNKTQTVSSSSSGGGTSKSNVSHKNGKAIGEIVKNIHHPQEGEWLIKISPDDATADIELNYSCQ